MEAGRAASWAANLEILVKMFRANGICLNDRPERPLRCLRGRARVANKRRSKRRQGVAQSLAVRPTKDSVTLARVREIVQQFAERDLHGEIITAVHHIPAREAKFAPMPKWVREDLAHSYAGKGVRQLYS